MAAQGTSNTVASRRWVATGATDDLNIDLDNDLSTAVYFPHPARITRVAFLATTAVVSTTAVKVEVYKNTSTLLGTWTVLNANEGLVAGAMALSPPVVYSTAGEVAEDGSTRFKGGTYIDVNAGDNIHLKVVEPSTSGAGIAYLEYEVRPVFGKLSTNVPSIGSFV